MISTVTDQASEVARIKEAHEKGDTNSKDTYDMFQTLFLAEIQSQDPMDPMSNEQFLTQISQFNMVSQLEELNNKVGALSQNGLGDASSLIGRVVTGLSRETEEQVTGVVISAQVEDKEIYLNLGNNRIKLDDATDVTDIAFLNTSNELLEEEV